MGFFDWLSRRSSPPEDAYDSAGPVALVIRQADSSLARGVQNAGRRAVIVSNGEHSLLDRIASLRPSVLVIGVESDGNNGFLILRSVKRDGRLKSLPVVIFSSEASEEVFAQHRKLRAAADFYVLGSSVSEINRVLDELRVRGSA